MKLEHIQEHEIDLAFKILSDGVKRLRENGIDQWQKGYPNREAIEHDFYNQCGYLLKDKNDTIAYVSITTTPEELYEALKGWKCPGPYAIVHRVSIHNDYANKGYSRILFEEIECLAATLKVSCIRIDTHPLNKPMLRIIDKNGYARVGEIMYPEGVRIAFEHCI